MNQILILSGAVITAIWGIAHLFPTKSVIKDFGDISFDNKRILAMEWINEGITLIFVGILTGGAALININSPISGYVFWVSSMALIVMAAVSFFTGFKINFLPYKLCPLLFLISAALFLTGYYL